MQAKYSQNIFQSCITKKQNQKFNKKNSYLKIRLLIPGGTPATKSWNDILSFLLCVPGPHTEKKVFSK